MQATDYEIKDAGSDQAELLASIIRQAFQDVAERMGLTPENAPTHPSNCTPEWIRGDLAKGVIYYLLEIHHVPCGCVALELAAEPDVGYLERLALLPAFRGKGYGKALAQHALEKARRHGCSLVSVGIIAEDARLKTWYGRLGFIEHKTLKLRHLPFEVMFMTKTL